MDALDAFMFTGEPFGPLRWNALIETLKDEIATAGQTPILPSTTLKTAANRTALAAISATAGASAALTESGRQGMFVFNSGNLSSKVVADTRQGIYVAPASDTTGASGAWVRQFSGPIEVSWFGTVADDATDDYAAFAGALTCIGAMSVTNSPNLVGGPRLHVKPGTYYVSQTLEPRQTMIIEGDGGGLVGAYPCVIRWPAGQTGVRSHRSTTVGASATGAAANASDGGILRGLALIGGYAGTEGEYHGVHMRSRMAVEDCYISRFQGEGVFPDGQGAQNNVNGFSVERCSIYSCRTGVRPLGGEGNAGTIRFVDASYNRQWGIEDASFLGCSTSDCHTSANGVIFAGSGVNYGGHSYVVRRGQEEAARTNAPTGTNGDNDFWLWVAAGPQAAWASWTNGMAATRASGSYAGSSPGNQGNSTASFRDCYSESSQGPAQIFYPATIKGGTHAAGVRGGTGHWESGSLGFLNIGANGVPSAYSAGLRLSSYYGTANYEMRNLNGSFVLQFTDGITPATILQGDQNGLSTLKIGGAGGGLYIKSQNTGTEWVNYNNAGLLRWHNLTAANDRMALSEAGALDVDDSFSVAGTKVVGARGAAVADVAGGSTVDTECRAQLNALLARIRAHGLIAT